LEKGLYILRISNKNLKFVKNWIQETFLPGTRFLGLPFVFDQRPLE
jgi:hypothetical protein